MFTDNDVSKAEEICDPNVKVHNLLVSQESTGLDAWKGQLSKIFESAHLHIPCGSQSPCSSALSTIPAHAKVKGLYYIVSLIFHVIVNTVWLRGMKACLQQSLAELNIVLLTIT